MNHLTFQDYHSLLPALPVDRSSVSSESAQVVHKGTLDGKVGFVLVGKSDAQTTQETEEIIAHFKEALVHEYGETITNLALQGKDLNGPLTGHLIQEIKNKADKLDISDESDLGAHLKCARMNASLARADARAARAVAAEAKKEVENAQTLLNSACSAEEIPEEAQIKIKALQRQLEIAEDQAKKAEEAATSATQTAARLDTSYAINTKDDQAFIIKMDPVSKQAVESSIMKDSKSILSLFLTKANTALKSAANCLNTIKTTAKELPFTLYSGLARKATESAEFYIGQAKIAQNGSEEEEPASDATNEKNWTQAFQSAQTATMALDKVCVIISSRMNEINNEKKALGANHTLQTEPLEEELATAQRNLKTVALEERWWMRKTADCQQELAHVAFKQHEKNPSLESKEHSSKTTSAALEAWTDYISIHKTLIQRFPPTNENERKREASELLDAEMNIERCDDLILEEAPDSPARARAASALFAWTRTTQEENTAPITLAEAKVASNE